MFILYTQKYVGLNVDKTQSDKHSNIFQKNSLLMKTQSQGHYAHQKLEGDFSTVLKFTREFHEMEKVVVD